jgi:hypothetical protein
MHREGYIKFTYAKELQRYFFFFVAEYADDDTVVNDKVFHRVIYISGGPYIAHL